jgi:hypothetical protein
MGLGNCEHGGSASYGNHDDAKTAANNTNLRRQEELKPRNARVATCAGCGRYYVVNA